MTSQAAARSLQRYRKARSLAAASASYTITTDVTTVEAAALFRAVAEEKTKRIEQDRVQAAAAWQQAGAIAGLADPKTARDAYRRAVELQPDDAEAQFWHGLSELEAGGLTAADAAFRRVLALFERDAASETEALWARLGVGDVLVAQGNLPAALQSYRASLAIAERLANADPGHAGWQRDLSVSQERIGDVLAAQGNLPAALASYRASLAIGARLASADPSHAGWQRDLSVSHNKIGEVLVAQGNLPAALESYRTSHAIFERLANSDLGNAGWQRDLSVSQEKIGDVLVAQGNLPAALASYQASLAIAERLANSDPGNAGWQRGLSVSHNKIGDVLAAQGNLPAALASYRASLAIGERLAKSDPGNAGWQREIAISHWRLAEHGDQPRFRYQHVVGILRDLDQQNRLAPADQKWLAVAEYNLAAAAQ